MTLSHTDGDGCLCARCVCKRINAAYVIEEIYEEDFNGSGTAAAISILESAFAAREAELRVWRSRLAQLVGQPDEDALPQRIEEELRSLRTQLSTALAENRALREVLQELIRAASEHGNEHGVSGDLGARLSDARAVLESHPPTDEDDAR